jgi:hypothetical protein
MSFFRELLRPVLRFAYVAVGEPILRLPRPISTAEAKISASVTILVESGKEREYAAANPKPAQQTRTVTGGAGVNDRRVDAPLGDVTTGRLYEGELAVDVRAERSGDSAAFAEVLEVPLHFHNGPGGSGPVDVYFDCQIVTSGKAFCVFNPFGRTSAVAAFALTDDTGAVVDQATLTATPGRPPVVRTQSSTKFRVNVPAASSVKIYTLTLRVAVGASVA